MEGFTVWIDCFGVTPSQCGDDFQRPTRYQKKRLKNILFNVSISVIIFFLLHRHSYDLSSHNISHVLLCFCFFSLFLYPFPDERVQGAQVHLNRVGRSQFRFSLSSKPEECRRGILYCSRRVKEYYSFPLWDVRARDHGIRMQCLEEILLVMITTTIIPCALVSKGETVHWLLFDAQNVSFQQLIIGCCLLLNRFSTRQVNSRRF